MCSTTFRQIITATVVLWTVDVYTPTEDRVENSVFIYWLELYVALKPEYSIHISLYLLIYSFDRCVTP